MAIDTQAYYYLVDPAAQFEGNSGKPLVGGWCCVYEAGTDNKVITLQDFDGTNNPFKVKLGSDGRCVMLVDIGKKYDLYVYDSFGNLALSRLNILPLTNGDITVQGLTKVYHDSATLSGDGTPTSPLTVIGGGGLSTVVTEWPVVGNGSQENPVTIEDITLLAHDDTLTSYDAEIEGKKSLVLGVNGDWFGSATSGFQEKSDMSNYVTNQTFINNNNSLNTKIDTKLDTSVFSTVSGSFALSADVDSALAGKQDTLTDYTPDTWNTVTNKLDTTAFSEVSGNFLTAHQSLEGYATENFVTGITDNKLDTSVYSSASGDFALKSEIPSVVGFMEESKLEYNADNLISGYNGSAFAGQVSDDIATKTWVNDQGFLTAHQSLDGYATEQWVSSQGYAHSSDIPTNVSQLNNDAGYLTEHQSLTAYALKSEIPVIGTIEV